MPSDGLEDIIGMEVDEADRRARKADSTLSAVVVNGPMAVELAQREIDSLMAERDRYKVALEEIAEGPDDRAGHRDVALEALGRPTWWDKATENGSCDTKERD